MKALICGCAFVAHTALLPLIGVVASKDGYTTSESDKPEMILKGIQGKLNKAQTFMTT